MQRGASTTRAACNTPFPPWKSPWLLVSSGTWQGVAAFCVSSISDSAAPHIGTLSGSQTFIQCDIDSRLSKGV